MTGRQNQGGSESRQEAGQNPRRSLHSEAGGLAAEHPGQSRNPVIKVAALAWLEFETPDLDHAAGRKEASSA